MANVIRRDNRVARSAGTEYGLDPFRAMDALLRWDGLRAADWVPSGPDFIPRFDVKETKGAYVIRADLPGVKESELDISLESNLLTISGKRDPDHLDEGDAYHAVERGHGTFARSFTMPESIDGEGVTADLKDGVLTLNVPKKPEAQPKRIAIGKGNESKARA